MESEQLKLLRTALADYMYAEGCSCCRNQEDYNEAKERLAGILGVPKYPDGSGFDFFKFRSGQKS